MIIEIKIRLNNKQTKNYIYISALSTHAGVQSFTI